MIYLKLNQLDFEPDLNYFVLNEDINSIYYQCLAMFLDVIVDVVGWTTNENSVIMACRPNKEFEEEDILENIIRLVEHFERVGVESLEFESLNPEIVEANEFQSVFDNFVPAQEIVFSEIDKYLENLEYQGITDTLNYPEYDIKWKIMESLDDIEFSVRYSELTRDIEDNVSFILSEFIPHQMGACHTYWYYTKIACAAYGLPWFSPAEYNPGTCYD